jgi:hypothetical protein
MKTLSTDDIRSPGEIMGTVLYYHSLNRTIIYDRTSPGIDYMVWMRIKYTLQLLVSVTVKNEIYNAAKHSK